MKTGDNHINHELQPVAPLLATIGRDMPYGVPEGYFAGFSENMMLLVGPETMGGVPPGYFEQFAGIMLQKVRQNEVREELEALSPLLNSISRTMPFYLPDGYFEQWQPVLPKETHQPPAKVISLGKSFRWKKWAAAAAILLMAGFGWQYMVNQPTEEAGTIVSTNVNAPSVDTLLNKVDANSLTGYLENEQANSEFSSLLSIAQQDIETGVKQLTNEELNWYLENQAIEIPGT